MFVPCTTLLYDSTAATRTLKLATTLLSISCGIRLISFLMMSSFACGLSSNTISQVPPQKIVRRVEILGIGWPGVIGLMRNESVPWEVMPEVFKCSVMFQGARKYLKGGVCENNPKTRKDIIRKEIRRIPQAILNRVVGNFNVRVAVVLSYTSAVHGVNIVLITEKV